MSGIPESLVTAIRTGLANNEEILKKGEIRRQELEEQRRDIEVAITAFLEGPVFATHVERSLNHNSDGYFSVTECIPKELQSSLNEIATRLSAWGFREVKVIGLGTHLRARIPAGFEPGEANAYGLSW